VTEEFLYEQKCAKGYPQSIENTENCSKIFVKTIFISVFGGEASDNII
jgi:hypothetical protein